MCLRKDLASIFLQTVNLFEEVPFIDMVFHEQPIIYKDIASFDGEYITDYQKLYWDNKKYDDKSPSDVIMRMEGRYSCFNMSYIYKEKVLPCLTAKGRQNYILHDEPRYISDTEIIKASTFPIDYNFCKKIDFIVGMCVPPVMMAQISSRIYEQWLSKL